MVKGQCVRTNLFGFSFVSSELLIDRIFVRKRFLLRVNVLFSYIYFGISGFRFMFLVFRSYLNRFEFLFIVSRIVFFGTTFQENCQGLRLESNLGIS